MGVCYCSIFCCTLLYVHSSIAIILMGKRELVALLNLSSWCLVMVERLFLVVPRGCLRFVIVVFPDLTHLLYFIQRCISKSRTLQEFLEEAGQIEDISLQMRDMKTKHDDKDLAKVVDFSQRNIRQRCDQVIIAHKDLGIIKTNVVETVILRFIKRGRCALQTE